MLERDVYIGGLTHFTYLMTACRTNGAGRNVPFMQDRSPRGSSSSSSARNEDALSAGGTVVEDDDDDGGGCCEFSRFCYKGGRRSA